MVENLELLDLHKQSGDRTLTPSKSRVLQAFVQPSGLHGGSLGTYGVVGCNSSFFPDGGF